MDVNLPMTMRLMLLSAIAIGAIFALSPLAACAQVRAEVRIALLIGNQSYDPSVGVLENPYHDIALVGAALAKQGFELLPAIKDASRTEILGAVRELVRRLNGAGPNAIGFIYYSGHGAADKDTNANYLIPVDVKHPGMAEFWDESVKLDDILQLLDRAPAAAKFVVFDACRTELQLPTKDTLKGLLPVANQRGMFIAYATAPGRTALDTGTDGGPYAAALAKELAKPGLDHLNLFQNVKEDVLVASNGMQQPWENNGLARRIYLTGKPPNLAQVVEQNFWAIVKDSDNPSVLQTYLDRYPNGAFADLAKASIEQRQREIKAKQAQAEAEERRAEEARAAAEAKQIEEAQRAAALQLDEMKRSETARAAQEKALADQLKQVLEEARSAKAAAQAAEERSKAALRDSEDARLATEATQKAQAAAKLAEERRSAAVKEAEQAKLALETAKAKQATGEGAQAKADTTDAETLRLAVQSAQDAQKELEAAEQQKSAALKEAEEAKAALAKLKSAQVPPPPTAAPAPASAAPATNPSNTLSKFAALEPDDLAKETQKELQRVGCDPGEIDGKWGEKGKAALSRFVKYTKVAIAADQPSVEALDIISAQRVRICPLECGEGEHAVGERCVAKPKDAPQRAPSSNGSERTSSASGDRGGYRTCGRNGCQWVPKGCTAVPGGGGHKLGGKIVCP